MSHRSSLLNHRCAFKLMLSKHDIFTKQKRTSEKMFEL